MGADERRDLRISGDLARVMTFLCHCSNRAASFTVRSSVWPSTTGPSSRLVERVRRIYLLNRRK